MRYKLELGRLELNERVFINGKGSIAKELNQVFSGYNYCNYLPINL